MSAPGEINRILRPNDLSRCSEAALRVGKSTPDNCNPCQWEPDGNNDGAARLERASK